MKDKYIKYTVKVNSQFYNNVGARTEKEMIAWARKKSKLFGMNYKIEVYSANGELFGEAYQGCWLPVIF